MQVASSLDEPICPSCQARRFTTKLKVHTTADYSVVRCGDCRLVYAFPRPTPTELAAYYDSHYFSGGKFTSDTAAGGYGDYFGLAEHNARVMWPDLCRYANLAAVNPRRVLDVGCASGGFLAAARDEGWEAVGVELSEHAADRARTHFKLNVINGDIFAEQLEPGSFGLVTIWHCLEHVIDPFATLKRANELLVPGGILFIEVPNWNSLGRIVKNERWAQLKPPEHINFFTRGSLRSAATMAGFNVLKRSTRYVAGFDRLYTSGLPKIVCRGLRGIEALAGQCGIGGYLRLMARKGV